MRHGSACGPRGAGGGALAGWLAAGLLLAAPAVAQERPVLRPTRDVDVTYMMARPDPGGGWTMLTERLRWAVGAGRLRIDPPTPGLWLVVDLASRQVATVQESHKRVLDGPAPTLPGEGGQGPYERRGPDRVGELACTNWALRDATGTPALACLTDDGVLLRAAAGGRVLLEALEVRYAPQPAALFALPADYRREPAPLVQR